MITGFNTDIKYEGVTYHVQTEDKGVDTPLILSLVYDRGTILASKRSPYDDLIAEKFDEKILAERLQKQHSLICAAIRAGRIEDLKRMTMKESSAKRKELVARREIKKAAPQIVQEEIIKTAEQNVVQEEIIETVPEIATKEFENIVAQTDIEIFDQTEVPPIPKPEIELVSEEKSVVKIEEKIPIPKVLKKEEKIPAAKIPEKSIPQVAENKEFAVNIPKPELSIKKVETPLRKKPEIIPAKDAKPASVKIIEQIEARASRIVEEEEVWDVPIEIIDEPIFEAVQIIEEELILPDEAVEIITDSAKNPSQESGKLQIKLLGDMEFKGGERKTIEILVNRGNAENGLSGAHVLTKVLGSAFRPLIFHSKTDSNGIATVHLQLPRFKTGRAAIVVKAMSDGEEIELRRAILQG